MKGVWVVISISLMLILGAASLSAQEATASTTAMTSIPVDSLASMVVLSPDDHTLAVYNNYNIYGDAPSVDTLPIRLIDMQTGETVATLSGYTDWVTGLAFNSDGSRIVSFHRNGDVNLWDVSNPARPIKTIQTYDIGGSWVQMLSDDHSILYRAGQFVVGILDTESGAITHLFGRHLDSYDEFSSSYVQFPGQGDISFAAAAASPDGHWVVTSTQNDEVLLWDSTGGDPVTLRPKSEQFGLFSIRSFAFAQDSSQLVYFDQSDKQTHFWDIATRKEIRTFAGGGVGFALAPDGKTIAWADRTSKAVYLADTSSTDAPIKLADLPESLDVAPITTVTFTSDGKQVIVGGLVAMDSQNEIYVIHAGA